MSGLKNIFLAAGFMLTMAVPFANAQAWGVDHDTTVGELASFDNFLDHHPRIQGELSRDPGLVRDPRYLRDHPELREYLSRHPNVREELRENPRAFMRGERWYERREDRWRARDTVWERDHDRDDHWRDRDDHRWRGNAWRDNDHDRDDRRWRDRDHDRDQRGRRDRDDWRRHQR